MLKFWKKLDLKSLSSFPPNILVLIPKSDNNYKLSANVPVGIEHLHWTWCPFS